jgi:hypothetical protein
VVSEDLLELERASATSPFEPIGVALVQGRTRRFRDRVVRSVPDQKVAEAICTLTGEQGLIRPDQPSAEERAQRGLNILLRHRLHLGDDSLVEHHPLDRSRLDDDALLVGETIEACGQ